MTVNHETSRSSSGDRADGRSGETVATAETLACGELFPTPFTVRWSQPAEWEQGSSNHVTLINGAEALDNEKLTFCGTPDYTVASKWDAWLVLSGDSMRLSPNDTDGLWAGETFSSGHCTEPHTDITDASP